MRSLKYDHMKQPITITLITLGYFYCVTTIKLRKIFTNVSIATLSFRKRFVIKLIKVTFLPLTSLEEF